MKGSTTLWRGNERTGKKSTNSCLPLKLSLLLVGGEDFLQSSVGGIATMDR